MIELFKKENFIVVFFKSLIKSNKLIPYPIYSNISNIIESKDNISMEIDCKKFYLHKFKIRMINIDDSVSINISKKILKSFNSVDNIKRIIDMLKYDKGYKLVAEKDPTTFFDDLEQGIYIYKTNFEESANFFKKMLKRFEKYNFIFNIDEDFFSIRIITPHVEENDYYYIFGKNIKAIQNEINYIKTRAEKTKFNRISDEFDEFLI
jgi:hypothetical protein